jgi:hypothetical protein
MAVKALGSPIIVAALFATTVCQAQGTITIGFQGPPPGQEWQIGTYTDPASGVQFGPLTPQRLYLNGGGISGYPNNGTCYLELPEGSMRFGPNTFPPIGFVFPFNLISFDAAEYHNFPPSTLTVVGYKLQDMAPVLTVTNYFTVSSQTFQTFHPDSSFMGVFQVDVLNASFSLDNLEVSGIPEPSTFALAVLATVCGLRRVRRGFKQ